MSIVYQSYNGGPANGPTGKCMQSPHVAIFYASNCILDFIVRTCKKDYAFVDELNWGLIYCYPLWGDIKSWLLFDTFGEEFGTVSG